MTKNTWVIAMVLLTGLLALPVQVWACACCSDENEYRINFHKPGAHERDVLRDIKFGPKAGRAESPASDEQATYSISGALAGNVWKLALRDGTKNGTLSLTLPPNMLSYAVDPHDGQKSPGGGPRLYKEWRFEGRATATGFLRTPNNSANGYFLVFQGWGNRCDNAEDFSHWRLELKGGRSRYALTGELARATAMRFWN